MTGFMNRIACTYHAWAAAYWEHQIDVARHERDWEALTRAVERRNHHEDRLMFRQRGQ